ncbi:uncharacterized protein LOC118509437 isoform X2 [Anopheles stephensi]|nr:uncharacterized protein LOC118509437 isoform X2 [Anopheles stephensi]
MINGGEQEDGCETWTISLQPEDFQRRATYFSAVSVTGPIEVHHTYNKQKARRYPPAATPEQMQQRLDVRDSLRIWRAKQYALYVLLQSQSEEAAMENRDTKLRVARQRAHVKSLRRLLRMPVPKGQVLQDITLNVGPTPKSLQQMKVKTVGSINKIK